LDALIFGSAVRGKTRPRDIDVALIFRTPTGLDEKLRIAQGVKEELEDDWQVLGVDINDLTDNTFPARTGILAEGYSLLRKTRFSNLLGFASKAVFTYTLTNLTNTQRTRLKYALSGRKKGQGLLQKWKGEFLGKGCIIIPIDFMDELRELLEMYKIAFRAKKVLMED
jgi:predicted nucleotidyltransferase